MIIELRVSYTKWHEVVAANSDLTLSHVYAGGEGTEVDHTEVRICAGNSKLLLLCTARDADETAWTADHASSSTECLTTDDAKAHAVGVPKPVPLTSVGLPAFSLLSYPEMAEDLMQSWIIDCPSGSVVVRDTWIGGDLVGPTSMCYLAAGAYEVWTKADRGSTVVFSMVDRDNISGVFPYIGMVRSKLTGLTSITGTFQVGEFVVGGTSQAKTKVLAIGASALDVRFGVEHASGGFAADGNDPAFLAGETITGLTSGATAILDGTTPFDEGDVLYLRKPFLKDEWIYRPASAAPARVEIRPGGSKAVPSGFYFRTLVYNANTDADLTIKTTLIMATR